MVALAQARVLLSLSVDRRLEPPDRRACHRRRSKAVLQREQRAEQDAATIRMIMGGKG
jgi:hypothetical protein